MKGLAIAGVVFGGLVAMFIMGVVLDQIGLLFAGFCGVGLFGYPALVVAIYRVATGRTDDGRGVALLSSRERQMLASYRQRQGAAE